MARLATSTAGAVTRDRFMVTVLGLISAIIGGTYLGVILRSLFPKSATSPPLRVRLTDQGVMDPATGALLPFRDGVAGSFYYPTVPDRSVGVGMFVEEIDPSGPLTEGNLRLVEQTCTHLGCPVNWVPADDRFECHCHGSQFRRDLTVYHGPAPRPLWQHRFTLAGSTLTIMGRE